MDDPGVSQDSGEGTGMVVAGRKAKAREYDALHAQRATSGKPRGLCPCPMRASSPALSFPFVSMDSVVSAYLLAAHGL